MTVSLDFCMQHYNPSNKFRDWLQRCAWTTFAHGAELVEALGSPSNGKPGMPDNVYAAEQCLKAALEAGLIVQGQQSPTRAQRFFGVGGVWLDSKAGLRHAGVTTYGYAPGPNMSLIVGEP